MSYTVYFAYRKRTGKKYNTINILIVYMNMTKRGMLLYNFIIMKTNQPL